MGGRFRRRFGRREVIIRRVRRRRRRPTSLRSRHCPKARRPAPRRDSGDILLGVSRRESGEPMSSSAPSSSAELGSEIVSPRLDARFDLRPPRAPMAAAASFAVGSLRPRRVRLRFLLEQRLPVGDRNLVIVRMDFGEGEEAVAIAAVVDEGRLQRRLDPRDLGEIDVAAQRPLVGRFEVEFLDPVTSQHHHPGLFRVGGVDDHLVGHGKLSRRATPRAANGPRPLGAARGVEGWRLGNLEGIGNRATLLQSGSDVVRPRAPRARRRRMGSRRGVCSAIGTSSP